MTELEQEPFPTTTVRVYQPDDYPALVKLYEDTGWFDKETDAEWKINRKSERDPESLLVAVQGESIVGSISILEDGRVAWFFRLVSISKHYKQIIHLLLQEAGKTLKIRGYNEALVYSLSTDEKKQQVYRDNGFIDGRDFHCNWVNIDTLLSNS